ncbi:hypothetical protein STEG23_023917 [Scotinomys teguina]
MSSAFISKSGHFLQQIGDAACEIFASWHISEIKEAACEIFASWHISEIGDAACEIFASWHISGALMEKRTFSPGSLIPQFTRWTFGHTFPTHRALRIIGILSPINLLDPWTYISHARARKIIGILPLVALCNCLPFGKSGGPNTLMSLWSLLSSEIGMLPLRSFASQHISEIKDAACEIFASWHISGALMDKRTVSPGSFTAQLTCWTPGHTFPMPGPAKSLASWGILLSKCTS